VVTFLIVVGCILAPLSVVAVWTKNLVSDADPTWPPWHRSPTIPYGHRRGDANEHECLASNSMVPLNPRSSLRASPVDSALVVLFVRPAVVRAACHRSTDIQSKQESLRIIHSG